ncbi:MAG TPA: hypothetical protein PKC24_10285 [Cyclobacteriaceae bacterium]|nr:hypothetical protein [Cyclobacteriaceae bacterium]
MRILKSIVLIINYKTIIVTVIALASTYVCHKYQLVADFPLILVSVAIVFPVVFSIDTAYKRRENALKHYADLRGHAIAIYYAMRDWIDKTDHNMPEKTKDLLSEILNEVRLLLKTRDVDVVREKQQYIFDLFSKLSGYTQEMRNYGLQSGEVSRVSQYVSKMMIAFDNMKFVHRYRTPVTLRAYSKGFIYAFPIIYGPYFGFAMEEYSSIWLGYIMPIMYSFILVSLDNIQDHLEDPYDEVGEDDIKFELNEFVRLLK